MIGFTLDPAALALAVFMTALVAFTTLTVAAGISGAAGRLGLVGLGSRTLGHESHRGAVPMGA